MSGMQWKLSKFLPIKKTRDFCSHPDMFISTLTISYKVHGAEFCRALSKPLLVTGMLTITIYIVAIRYFYLCTGLYSGTFLSVCISGICTWLTFRYILAWLS
jgi:hypothetical protein